MATLMNLATRTSFAVREPDREPDPVPELCSGYWQLRLMLDGVASDSPAEQQLLSQMRIHMRNCPECQAWWQWSKTQGHVEPHKD